MIPGRCSKRHAFLRVNRDPRHKRTYVHGINQQNRGQEVFRLRGGVFRRVHVPLGVEHHVVHTLRGRCKVKDLLRARSGPGLTVRRLFILAEGPDAVRLETEAAFFAAAVRWSCGGDNLRFRTRVACAPQHLQIRRNERIRHPSSRQHGALTVGKSRNAACVARLHHKVAKEITARIHTASVISFCLVELDVRVPARAEGSGKKFILLHTSLHFNIPAACKEAARRQRLCGSIVERRPLIHFRRVARIFVLEPDFADVEMLGHLPGKRYDSRQICRFQVMFRQPSVVQAYHCRKIPARRNAGNEHLLRIAAVAGYVLERPRDRRCRIAYSLCGGGVCEQSVSTGNESNGIILARLLRP